MPPKIWLSLTLISESPVPIITIILILSNRTRKYLWPFLRNSMQI